VSTTPARRAAYCDVDGTLAATTIVTPLIWFKRRQYPAPVWWLWMLSLGVRGPWWLLIDRFDRSASNRAIYSSYSGMRCDLVEKLKDECYQQCVRPRLFPTALARMEELKRDGVKIVLVTGGLDFVMEPLARQLDADCIAPCLLQHEGKFTGEMNCAPLTREQKAEAVRKHAAENNIDLALSLSFGDAMGDLEMLECVGEPVAVNPDSRLTAQATSRGWKMERWRLSGK